MLTTDPSQGSHPSGTCRSHRSMRYPDGIVRAIGAADSGNKGFDFGKNFIAMAERPSSCRNVRRDDCMRLPKDGGPARFPDLYRGTRGHKIKMVEWKQGLVAGLMMFIPQTRPRASLPVCPAPPHKMALGAEFQAFAWDLSDNPFCVLS